MYVDCNNTVSHFPKVSHHKISCLRSPSKRQAKREIKANEWWKKQLEASAVHAYA